MGNVFLLLITLLTACRWLSSSMLETTNFIEYQVFMSV
jgi:hypothetical protein